MPDIVMVIHQQHKIYGASFPDYPGATTVAGDLGTVYHKATAMLAAHIAGLLHDGDPIPSVRSLDELRLDPAFVEDSRGAEIETVFIELPETSRDVPKYGLQCDT